MVIIGAGRVGSSLGVRARERGVPVQVLGRDDRDHGGGPILVATRNDDLPAVLEAVPAERHGDLVFVQNGWLGSWLAEQGLAGNTRGLLYFAATARDGAIEPGQASVFTGPHAPVVVDWFGRLDLEAEVLSAQDYGAKELEKLAWLCVFGPLCRAHGCSVGEVMTQHRDRLEQLTGELAAFGRVVGVEVDEAALLEGLMAYSRTIPTYVAGVKEWRWRNGAVLAAMAQAGVDSPLQRELLSDLL